MLTVTALRLVDLPMRIAGSKLAIYFAISGAIDRFERGTAAAHLFGFGKKLVGPEDAQEQRGLFVHARETCAIFEKSRPKKRGKRPTTSKERRGRTHPVCSSSVPSWPAKQKNPKCSNWLPLRKPIDAPIAS